MTSNQHDEAHVDIRAQGFWGDQFQSAFFDIRHLHVVIVVSHHKHVIENTKDRRLYEQSVREIEHESFTPFVLSTAEGMGDAAKMTYKRLASFIAHKQFSII